MKYRKQRPVGCRKVSVLALHLDVHHESLIFVASDGYKQEVDPIFGNCDDGVVLWL